MKSYHNAVVQRKRVFWVFFIFVALVAIISYRVVELTIVKHDYFFKLAASQHWIKDVIPAKRGKIYAADTISSSPYLLATNQALDLVFVEPKKLENKEEAAQFLSVVLGMALLTLMFR